MNAMEWKQTVWYTVYRENLAPILILTFSPSDLKGKFRTRLIELFIGMI